MKLHCLIVEYTTTNGPSTVLLFLPVTMIRSVFHSICKLQAPVIDFCFIIIEKCLIVVEKCIIHGRYAMHTTPATPLASS
jgi:hypothetical protein